MKRNRARHISRARIIALPAAAALFLSCLPGERLAHLTRAVERTDVEITAGGSALIRSVFCDIMLEPADGALWDKLGKTAAYMKKPVRGARRRVPPLAAFHVIIKSTVSAPLRLERSRILFGDTARDCLTRDAIAGRLTSPAYSFYDFAGLLSYRRLTADRDSSRWIDYDRETIASTFDFIPPYDAVVTMLLFEKPPAEHERFRLTLELSASGNKKIISCDFTRRDYRAGDREYIKFMKETGSIDDE